MLTRQMRELERQHQVVTYAKKVITITDILSDLEHSSLTFCFTKKDGTQRRMVATRDLTIIGEPIVERSEKVVTVWDVEQQGFRSINKSTPIELV